VIAAIPTVYRCRVYRSLLEAKWAAFFDLLGWPFEYEPFELPGWIPDFILCGAVPVLVEIKPVADFPPEIGAEVVKAAADGGRNEEVLIVGVAPLAIPRFNGNGWGYQLGWLAERHNGAACWGDALMGQWRESERAGFCHADGSWRDRISGRHDRCIGGLGERINTNSVWAAAANEVQWRGGNDRGSDSERAGGGVTA
jgi:hypothetical protein